MLSPQCRRRLAGLTLTETVIATFLLVVGFLIIGALYFSSLRQQSKVDAATLSTILAERVLEEVRVWAQTPANFTNLETVYSPYLAQDQGFQIEVEARSAVPIASPCSQLETAFAADRRVLTGSYKPLQVRVSQGGQVLTLDSLIGDPPRVPRNVVPLVVTPVVALPVAPAALSMNGTVDFTATLVDGTGQPIPDIFFTWNLAPVSGTGRFSAGPRDGRAQTFQHRMMLPDGTWDYSPGVPDPPNPALASVCNASANCLYRGLEYTGDSADIRLEPPP